MGVPLVFIHFRLGFSVIKHPAIGAFPIYGNHHFHPIKTPFIIIYHISIVVTCFIPFNVSLIPLKPLFFVGSPPAPPVLLHPFAVEFQGTPGSSQSSRQRWPTRAVSTNSQAWLLKTSGKIDGKMSIQ